MLYDDRKDLPIVYAIGYLMALKYGQDVQKVAIKISENILSNNDFGLNGKETASMILRCDPEQLIFLLENFKRIALGGEPAKFADSNAPTKTKKQVKKNEPPQFKLNTKFIGLVRPV